jgi:hypothetical protein
MIPAPFDWQRIRAYYGALSGGGTCVQKQSHAGFRTAPVASAYSRVGRVADCSDSSALEIKTPPPENQLSIDCYRFLPGDPSSVRAQEIRFVMGPEKEYPDEN